jgi:hypothetical protein
MSSFLLPLAPQPQILLLLLPSLWTPLSLSIVDVIVINKTYSLSSHISPYYLSSITTFLFYLFFLQFMLTFMKGLLVFILQTLYNEHAKKLHCTYVVFCKKTSMHSSIKASYVKWWLLFLATSFFGGTIMAPTWTTNV